MKISQGRIVLYVLSREDVENILIQRRIHTLHGNPVREGDILPALVVRVLDGEDQTVNLQVFMDGCDTYWALSRRESAKKEKGSWHWPDRK